MGIFCGVNGRFVPFKSWIKLWLNISIGFNGPYCTPIFSNIAFDKPAYWKKISTSAVKRNHVINSIVNENMTYSEYKRNK